MAEKKNKGFDRPVSIQIHNRRQRLADPDGLCAKYLIDSLVTFGLLPDDRPEDISEITHTQEKVKGPEETIVTILQRR